MSKYAVVIPAYNEQQAISDVINAVNTTASLNGIKLDVIVVNDCSIDSTATIIAELNCIALNLPVNLGIGGAVQTGFKYAFENGYDFAFQIDGDGQHPPEELPKLIRAREEHNWDVVIGSRFIDKIGFQSTLLRRTGINYFKFLIRSLAGVRITDSTSGFRMINRKTLAIVNEYYPDEYPEPEAIILYAKNNLNIGETPVNMRERQGGISSIGKRASVYYMLKVSLAIIFTFIRIKRKK
ncbi:MAG: glycosyltransferase family 2 protein [Bacteroidetes bacterium]|nr:glycosyltransferase family 2 protein [Bacteroidota bacterium]